MPAGKKYRYKKGGGRKVPRKKNARKKFAMVRQPMVETKYKESAGETPLTDGAKLWIPDSWEFAVQGNKRSEISGRWIFSKWLSVKMRVDYQQSLQTMGDVTYRYIFGWCKLNHNPTMPATGPIQVDTTALQAHVYSIVNNIYADPLAFTDKRRLKVLGDRTVISKPHYSVQRGALAADPIDGNYRAPIFLYPKWTPMRKIRYNHCHGEDGAVPPAMVDFMTPNTGNWVPFIYFKMSPSSHPITGDYPVVAWKTRHWFTDS